MDNLKTDIEVQRNDTVHNIVLQLKGYSISNLQVITGKMFGNKTLKVFYLFSLTLLKNQRVIKIVKTKHEKTVYVYCHFDFTEQQSQGEAAEHKKCIYQAQKISYDWS